MTLEATQSRIEYLSARIRNPVKSRIKRRRPSFPIDKAREQQLRNRRELLESERPAWTLLVQEYGGNVTAIAQRMGVDWNTAQRALWDLGLWPAVERARRSK